MSARAVTPTSAPRHGSRAASAGDRRRRASGLARRVPRAAWICGLIACLNAICWSLVTPAFQVPDEPSHFAYVKQLAETGELPTSSSQVTSSEESAALTALHQVAVRQRPQNQAIATNAEQRQLESALAAAPHETGSPAAGVATSQPPLYYALEAIPYTVARGSTVLDRLALMRLASSLFAGLSAVFVFLFLREALPRAPWAWTVGGLSVALAPLLGFMSGAVNPDAMLFAASASLFYCLARAFRRGLSARRAAAIGAVSAIGLLTKLNFAGLLPGIALALALLTLRAARAHGASTALRWLAFALALGAVPLLAYAGVEALSHESLLRGASVSSGSPGSSPLAELDYIWQLYLPRLPGTADYFPGLFTTRQLWFDGYVGLYGWLDTVFPSWVYDVALIPAGAIALLCARALVQARAALRSRAGELLVYATLAAGLMALVGAASFTAFPQIDAEYAQARYLLPLLPLLGAVLALAARGAGRRWGPSAGALIVVLFLAHDLFSQLLVVARYYG